MNLEGSEHVGIGLHALVVEDDVTIAELVARVLRPEGFIVTVTHDCASARAAIEEVEHDVVFVDLKLPDGDGLDLLAWFKEQDHRGAVIVMTAFRQEDKALRAYDLGAQDFVAKPFKPRELLTRARHVIQLQAT